MLAAQPGQRGDRVALAGLALARHDRREGGHVHHQVDDQVQHRGLHAELRGDDDAGQHVARLGDRGVGEHPLQRGLAERADVADEDRDRRQRGERGRPARVGFDQGDVEEAQEGAERCDLGGHRHEGRHRRGGSLVDVGRPLVEGRDRGLEAQPGHAQGDAGQRQHVGREPAPGQLRGDPAEVGRAGRAVDHRQAVEQRRRADRADDQVLQPRLQRVLAAHFRGAEHIQRDRQELEADEQRDGVLGRGEQRHAGDGREQQRVELAVRGFLARPVSARPAAPCRCRP